MHSQTLGAKIEGLTSCFEDMECHLDSMKHRMASLEISVVDLYWGTESKEACFKVLNRYLLEIIKREHMVL